MDDEKTDLAELAGTTRAREILRESETLVEDVLAALADVREQLVRGELEAVTDINKMRGTLASVRLKLREEVERYEEHVAHGTGRVAAAPLDFDKLRGEIGRKLDRLRDSCGAEGVS